MWDVAARLAAVTAVNANLRAAGRASMALTDPALRFAGDDVFSQRVGGPFNWLVNKTALTIS